MKGRTTSSPGATVAIRPSVPTSVRLSGGGGISARALSRPAAAKPPPKSWRAARPRPRAGHAEADWVHARAGDGDLGRSGARVLHPEAEDEGRDAGIVRIHGDERIERFERDLERDLAVGGLDLGGGVFALEPGFFHARQAGDKNAAETEAGRERRLDGALEDADELRSRLVEIHGEKREGHVDALAGPVEDLPVAEVAAAAEGDRARADAAEREGDLVEGPPLEGARRPGAQELVPAVGRSR